jgi:hypothetical protein
MTNVITSHCWVRIVDATKDPLDPADIGLLSKYQPTWPTLALNWGVPNNSRIASWQSDSQASTKGSWRPSATAWSFTEPTLGTGGSVAVIDFGPAFDSEADAHAWIETSEGKAWGAQAAQYQLLGIRREVQGVPLNLAPTSVTPKPSRYPLYPTPQQYLFDQAWWGQAFLELHEQPINDAILDHEKLWGVDLGANCFADTTAECQALFNLQQSRTSAEESQCIAEAQGSSALVWPILKTTQLKLCGLQTVAGRLHLEKLLIAVEKAVYQQKLIYRRARPAQLDSRLKPVFKGPRSVAGDQTGKLYPGHPSFPSGHSTMAHTLSKLLDKLGAATEETEKVARALAFNRELAGVHYRSDSAAGEYLADAIVTQMFERGSNAEAWLAEFGKLTS